jgi:hypothetical protein
LNFGPESALPLPAISADAVDARAPRECHEEAGITTGCTYQ